MGRETAHVACPLQYKLLDRLARGSKRRLGDSGNAIENETCVRFSVPVSSQMQRASPSALPAELHLLHLPDELIRHVLWHGDVRTVATVACCSRSLLETTADTEVWSSLLRHRHRALLGGDDPHLTLLPSAARVASSSTRVMSGGRPPPRGTQQWLELYRQQHELYRVCLSEWIVAAAQTPPHRRRRGWFWRFAFEAPDASSRHLLFALVVLRLAYDEYIKLVVHCVLAVLCAACCAATVYGACLTGLEGLEAQEVCDRLLAVMPGRGESPG